jgi:AraC-like DNA-binding protein
MADFLLLLTGGIGLLTTCILIFNNHSNRLINYYFIFICLYLSFFALLKSTYNLGIQDIVNQRSFGFKRLSLFLFPSLYLFFHHIIHPLDKWRVADTCHFIIPIAFFSTVQILDFLGYLSAPMILNFYIFYFLFICSYWLLSIRLFIRSYSINSFKQLFEKSETLQKKWILFMLLIFTLICLRVGILVFMDLYFGTVSGFENGIWIWAILISGIFIKLLVSPELLFGPYVLKNKIEANVVENEMEDRKIKDRPLLILNIWKFEKMTHFNNRQDELLSIKATENLLEKIVAIEEAVLKKRLFRNSNFDLQSLALEINVPKSHLTYLFKYHCSLFFSDFKRMLQIRDAKELMANGFLTENTLESLSARVGFSSYNPFYIAFKKYTGVSPQDYLKQYHQKVINS